MIILIIEIALVLAGFGALVVATMEMGRQAAALARASKRLQEQAEPKAARLAAQADTARELGLRVVERSELLENRGVVLSVTMNKMAVLIDAAADTKRKLDKVTGYIGL
jgi:hypothetical protein